MSDLQKELLIHILVRLPVRSLLRLRSVCKSWCALITSPRFVHLHTIRQNTIGDDSILIKHVQHGLQTSRKLSYYLDFDSLSSAHPQPHFNFLLATRTTPPGHKFHMFAGHSNGIHCFTDGDFNVFLFNPALRQIRPLPIVPSWRPVEWREYGIGFGFDQATNDYKVVRITKKDKVPTSPMEVEIYNLSTDSWRNFGTIPGPPTTNFHGLQSPIYFKGLIHWSEWGAGILTFNTITEVFEAMPYPCGWQDYSPSLEVISKLLVMDNSTIALVASTKDITKFGWLMDVWVMKKYGVSESWVKLHSVPPEPPHVHLRALCAKKNHDASSWARLMARLDKFPLRESASIKPLSFWKKDILLLVASNGNLICYDFATNQYYYIQPAPLLGKDLLFYELVVCKESLVSIYSN